MSVFRREENEYKQLAASDTFLSRVFGLHSVYNRLPENYQYYDPESELYDINSGEMLAYVMLRIPDEASVGFEAGSSRNPEENSSNIGRAGDFLRPPEKNLLDSESGLDLSSSESLLPPSPLLRVAAPPPQKIPALMPTLNWNSQANIPQGENPSNPQNQQWNGVTQTQDNTDTLPSRSLMFQFPGLNTVLSPEKKLSYKRQKESYQPVAAQYRQRGSGRMAIQPKERALYLWANITNMDEFLIDVYYYYRGKGFASIVLARVVDVCILVFVLLFATFLRWGIDYDYFFNEWSSNSDVNLTLSDLVILDFLTSKVPLSVKILLLGFCGYTILRMLQLYFDYRYKLSQLLNFYRHLLDISDDLELMTISWSTIVERLMLLKDQNSLTATHSSLPHPYLNDLNLKVRLSAHDIANRIMRKENYMIALINKDVLDLSLPAPRFLQPFFSSKAVLTRALEWSIMLCINNFVFNEHGQINPNILKETSRNALALELSSRFKMAAIINLLLCPFIVVYFVLLYFFRYFNEYKSNPSSILGLRQYTPWAEWKLREFNELSHFFIKRLHLSTGPANTYINQFPGGVFVVSLSRLLNFVLSAFLAVLVIFGLLFDDEEHRFWSFELTQNRSTLFYISMFGTVWAVTSGTAYTSTVTNSAENLNTQGVSFFYDPEASLRYVSQFTHYLPSSWNGKLHTVEVKNKFCDLFSLKIVLILNEILSLVLTPFILWFKVSGSSSAIVDFFREYTIHVDGLGHLCYFAMFNFEEKDKNMMYELNKKRGLKRTRPTPLKGKATQTGSDGSGSDEGGLGGRGSDSELHDYYQEDKMIKSYMYFLESYGNKTLKSTGKGATKTRSNPQKGLEGPSSSVFLSKRPRSARNDIHESDSLHDQSYNLSESIEASMKLRPKGRKGVLGMINQFSKQDTGR